MPKPPRILSGVQPSGKLHLGNYFGAIRQHIALVRLEEAVEPVGEPQAEPPA